MIDIVAATGLTSEARAIARPGWRLITCGGHGDLLRARLEAEIACARPDALVSIGLAGGLDPALTVGDVVVATSVIGPARDRWAPTAIFAAAGAGSHTGPIAGVATPAASRAEKAALHAVTGAIAVDMESHIIAAVAAAHGLAFAAVRVIGDGADTDLPMAARVPLGSDGSIRLGAVLAAVARRPTQIPALIRLGAATGRALDRLRRLDLSLAG